MVNENLGKLKELQLDILKYIDKICRKNNINYYLVGGSLLGAVRHKGIIPWDDDIDLGMFREDYNKFIEIMIKNNNERYFVQNYKTDSNYMRYITKIRLNGTKFIEKSVEDIDMHHGIFIDIFPLDKVDENKENLINFRAKLGTKILTLNNIKLGRTGGSTKFKTKVKGIMRTLLKVIPSKKINQFVDYIYSYSNNQNLNYVTNFGSQYGWRKQTFPIDVYGEGTYLEFEGHKFMAPAKWEVILKSLYGDYMKLPPIEKRNSGHDVVHIDLGEYK